MLRRFIHSKRNSSRTDAELLAHFQQEGAEAAFVSLFERYLELIYGLCLKYLANEQAAQDAVMDIYVALRQKVPKHEIHHFKNWLFTFVRNHCLMELRRQKRQPEISILPELMQSEAVWHPIEEVNKREVAFTSLEDCLTQLQAQQKLCVELFYYKGLSYKDIAEQLGKPIGKVRSYIQNGRRNLKNCIEQKMGDL